MDYRKRIVQYALIVLLTALLMYYLLKQVALGDIWSSIVSVGLLWLIASFVLYYLSVFIRAVRFWILLQRKISVRHLLTIAYLHNLANNMLPTFLGEFSFVMLARRTGSVTVGESTAAMVIARFFDITAAFVLTALALFFVPNPPQQFTSILVIIGAVIILLFLLAVVLVVCRERSLRFLGWIGTALHLSHLQLYSWVMVKLREMIDAVVSLHSFRMYMITSVVSFLVWILAYLQVYMLMVGMGFTLPFMTIALGTSLYRLAQTLPVYGVGGFGTAELSWAVAFILLGMSSSDAIVTGFSVHIISLVFSLVLGGVGAFTYFWRPKPARNVNP